MEAGSKVLQYHQTVTRLSIFFMLYIADPVLFMADQNLHARRGLSQSVCVRRVQDMLCGGCIEQELWLMHNVLCYKGKILYQETLFRNALL